MASLAKRRQKALRSALSNPTVMTRPRQFLAACAQREISMAENEREASDNLILLKAHEHSSKLESRALPRTPRAELRSGLPNLRSG